MVGMDDVADGIVEHRRLVIVLLLVVIGAVGAGAAQVEDSASLSQFETSSDEAQKLEYIDSNFGTGGNTTTVQVIVREDNVLARESLLDQLRFERDLVEDDSINRTLADSQAPAGISNVVAIAAIRQEQAANLTERGRALQAERQRLEHLISRVNGLVRDVMAALMGAETSDDVRTAVCEQFVAAEPYVQAWIADVDLRTGGLVGVAGAPDAPTDVEIGQQTPDDPVARATETTELQVVSAMEEVPESSVHQKLCPDAKAMAALPLVADDSLYGILVVYADESDAFDERERVILEALGRTVATAINAIERKRLLTADTVVEVELEIADRGAFVFDLSRDLDCELTYGGAVPQDEDTYLLFFTASGCATQALLEQASEYPEISAAAHVSDFESGSFFEFEVADPPIVSTLASHGGRTRSITVSKGVARVEAELAGDANVRALVDALSETFESVELVAYRERERPTQTREEFVSQLMAELTDRQRTALQKAFVGGFFEWPRATSGEELAASMDISPSTYHQHLRAAQRKLVTQIFDG